MNLAEEVFVPILAAPRPAPTPAGVAMAARQFQRMGQIARMRLLCMP
jgi:hypothetical protein